MGPLEADVVRVTWAANAPLSVRHVLQKLNEGRSRPLRYTTVQTVMARLARKRVLARSRHEGGRPLPRRRSGCGEHRRLAPLGPVRRDGHPAVRRAGFPRARAPGSAAGGLGAPSVTRPSRRPHPSCRMLVSSAPRCKESGDCNRIHVPAGGRPCSDSPVGAEGEREDLASRSHRCSDRA
ncbi:MAG: BlaI/MecI/CopY family transcriptional regulator [Actinomycetota bacterium]